MKHFDIIIAGSGAAGLQLAYRISHDAFFSDKKILLIDQDEKNANDRTWCYWERGEGSWDDIVRHTWKNVFVKTDQQKLSFDLGAYSYKMVRSADFYRKVYSRLRSQANFSFKVSKVLGVMDFDNRAEIVLEDEKISADLVLSSIPDFTQAMNSEKFPFLIQHFGGWFIKSREACFDSASIEMMDFSVPQKGNTRFMYVLPHNAHEALVEYTLFSDTLLQKEEYEASIVDYLQKKGITDYEITEKEFGQIPMTCFPFHKNNGRHLHYLGSAGGWTKPSTGYTFYHAGKKSREVVDALKSVWTSDTAMPVRKYRFYDAVVLDLLKRRNDLGAAFFASVYGSNKIEDVFDFLNEESNLKQDLLLILRSKPRMQLLISAMRVLWSRAY